MPTRVVVGMDGGVMGEGMIGSHFHALDSELGGKKKKKQEEEKETNLPPK